MSSVPDGFYELSWNYAQDGKIAIDLGTGTIVNINPAAEAMSGYCRGELLGMPLTRLAPEDERERVTLELRESTDRPTRYLGFHTLRKDGVCVPISISTSGAVDLNGRRLVIAEFRDITDQENYERKLAAQNWALSAFSHAASALSRATTEEELLRSICEAITTQSAYVLAYVSVAVGAPEKPLRLTAASGSAAGYVDGLRLSWAEDDPDGQGPSGVCIRTRHIHIVDDLESNPSFERWRERARRFGVRSVAGIPLSTEDGWQGALIVFSTESGAFAAEPVQVFQRLGEQIAHGIQALRRAQLLETERENVERARRNLADALDGSVAALATTMEVRGPYTAGHQGRVAEISVAIGREMGWDEERLQGLRLGALVHDIGKIAIPAGILTKSAPLSPAELALTKAHPETGYAILKDVPFPWPVAEMVRQHHERLDGSGYPRGIGADRILPEARVLAVADVVEAMASDRPYRQAHGLEIALNEIERMAGSQLDIEVVRVCSSLFREGRLVIPGLDWN